MRIRLLPSNLSDPAHLQPLTTFLINDSLAIDGGSIGLALGLEAQRALRHVIITHSHADHTATLPMFIAETFPFLHEPVCVHGTREVIASLRRHVFNGTIWPDFEQIRLLNGNGMGLGYHEVCPPEPFEIGGLRLTPVWTNHTVPTIGLAIEEGDASILITSDTYHTDEIWEVANRLRVNAVFVDVSYPNEMASLAEDSKHLTPRALDVELAKMDAVVPVFAVHLKPQFRTRTIEQLAALGRPNVTIGEIGKEYRF
jgi:ribonuclease BN (tRNA processing enzyme)